MPPSSTAHTKIITPWCDKIAKDSGGRLKCQIYPSMQMGGSPQQLFDQAKDGVADIIWTVPPLLYALAVRLGRAPATAT